MKTLMELYTGDSFTSVSHRMGERGAVTRKSRVVTTTLTNAAASQDTVFTVAEGKSDTAVHSWSALTVFLSHRILPS